MAIACDVSREDDIRDSIEQTVADFGGLHIVVNNAGMVQVKMLHECTEADWDLVMGVNVKSMFLATKHAMPHLRRNRRSYIVNVGSDQQFRGPGQDADLHDIQARRARTDAFHRPGLRRRRHPLQLRLSGNHRHAHAARASGCDAGPGGRRLAGRLRRVAMGVALTPAGCRQVDPLFQLRRLGGRHRHFADDRLRLLDGRRMGNAGPTAFQEPVMTTQLACADFAFPLLPHDACSI